MRAFSLKTHVSWLVLLASLAAQALPESVKQLAYMETKANAVAVRDNSAVKMPHYEIPLRLLTEDKAFNLDAKLYGSMVFKKDNELYVRWVVNPEDTKWHKDVEKFMIENGLTPTKKYFFTGYQTASRSYLVEDPSKTVQFSIKASTDKTGGNWTDKKQYFQDGFDIRQVSDLIARAQMTKPFENIVIMQEPLTFGIQSIDQSIVVRELGSLSKSSEFIYIPGFSVLHEAVGIEIAAKNGSSDPQKYWTDNYILPMAKAAAEMVARTGIWFDSPHGQNFLVELDKNMKPTGRMVLRDLGDIYLNESFMKAMNEETISQKFSEQSNIKKYLSVSFGPLHGNKAPTWITTEQYVKWGELYNETLAQELSKQTKIPVASLSASPTAVYGQFSYFGSTVNNQNPEWLKYLNESLPKPVRFCSQVYY